MKSIKYYLFCALLLVSPSVFARSTFVYDMPGGYMITDFNRHATYVYNMPGGDYMVTDFRHKPAYINKIPGGYMYDIDEMSLYNHAPIDSILVNDRNTPYLDNQYDYNNYDCDNDDDY